MFGVAAEVVLTYRLYQLLVCSMCMIYDFFYVVMAFGLHNESSHEFTSVCICTFNADPAGIHPLRRHDAWLLFSLCFFHARRLA